MMSQQPGSWAALLFSSAETGSLPLIEVQSVPLLIQSIQFRRSLAVDTYEAPVRDIAAPELISSGEILNWKSLDLGMELGRGRRGIVFAASLDGIEVAAKVYNGTKRSLQRLIGLGNEAASEYMQVVRAREDFPQLRSQLQVAIGWLTHPELGPVLLSQPVRDCDGKFSPSLEKLGNLSTGFSARVLDLLDRVAAGNRLLRPTPGNILLRTIAPGNTEPVLIDLQNYEAPQHYPLLGILLALGTWTRGEITDRWITIFKKQELDPRCAAAF